MRLKLIIAYDGRPFQGWQSQPSKNTVQDHLEAAATELVGGCPKIHIHGSGRTDTGVHALGQVAHFDPPENSRLTPPDWIRALNAKLPPEIRIIDCSTTEPDFHARFSAVGKTYCYEIITGRVLPPHQNGLAWHVPVELDLDRLRAALTLFQGTHNFTNFAAFRGTETEAQKADPDATTRTIHAATLKQPAPDKLTLIFNGTGFLYKMVRLLTGAALRVAAGRDELQTLHQLLHEPAQHEKSNHCAPPDGLYLVEVTYPNQESTPA
ncbi:MAG: tRNA pseudouridine(38-40) synthase TruA [Verrucomicrobiota bacterium]